MIAGDLRPAQSPLVDALQVRLGREAFGWAADEAARQLDAFDLDAALRARNPLVNRVYGRGLGRVSVRADVRWAAKGTPTVQLVPARGALRVRVVVPNVRVALGVVADPRLGPTIRVGATLQARRAVLTAEAVPVVAGGALQTRLRRVRVDLQGFAVDVAYLPGFVDRWIADAARGAVANLLAAQVQSKVPPAIDAALLRAVGPRRFTLAGHPVQAQLTPQALRLDPRGATLVATAQLAGLGGEALVSAHPLPPVDPGAAVGLDLDDDLLNRVAHAAWRAGALDRRWELAAAGRALEQPWLAELDAGVLAPLLPALADVPPDTPLALQVVAHAPPVARPLADGALELGLGDVELRILAVPGEGAEQVAARLFVTTRVTLAARVDAAGRVSLERAAVPTLALDVVDAAGPLRERGFEVALAEALPAALETLLAGWGGLSLPLPPEAPAGEVSASRRGADRLGVTWTPAPAE